MATTPSSAYDAFTADATAPSAQPQPANPNIDALEASFSAKPTLAIMPPQSGSAADSVWSAVQGAGSAAARILSKTGYGIENAWGADPYDFSTERQKLVKAGALDDYDQGHQTFVKGATEFLMRNAVILGNLPSQAMRLPGAILGGVSAGAEQAGQEIEGKNPTALSSAIAAPFKGASELTADPTWMFGLGLGPEEHTAAGTGAAVAARETIQSRAAIVAAHEAETLATATKARAMGVLGEGEAGYHDAVQPTPQNLQARAQSAEEAGITVPPPDPAPDVHVLARRVDPDTFEQFDALAAERAEARESLAALAAEREARPEAIEARDELHRALGIEIGEAVSERGLDERIQAVASSAGEDMLDRVAKAYDRYDALVTEDNPEMVAARNRLMQADMRMRDLAPDVSEAYRQAREMAPDLTQVTTETKPEGAEGVEGSPERVAPVAVQASAEAAGVEPGPNVFGKEKLGEGATESSAEKQIGVAGASDADSAETGQSGSGGEPATDNNAPTSVAVKPSNRGALKEIKGKGDEQVRRVSERAEENAIASGLTENFSDLQTYDRLKDEDQARIVKKTMDKDPQQALDIAMGRRAAPQGVTPEAFLIGVENRALAEGDLGTLMQLKDTRLAQAGTTMGQRLSTYRLRNKASPLEAIREVQAARETELAARTGGKVDAAKRAVENEERPALREEIKAATRQRAGKVDAWASFIQSIKC